MPLFQSVRKSMRFQVKNESQVHSLHTKKKNFIKKITQQKHCHIIVIIIAHYDCYESMRHEASNSNARMPLCI